MASRDEHAEIRELSGAAALRILTPDEAARASAHLGTCAACRAEYAELRAVADLLLRAPEPVEPSPELRARVLAAVAREAESAEADGASPAAAPSPAPPPVSIASRRRRWDWRDLGLVASLVTALFFGYSTAQLRSDVAATSARLAQQDAIVRAATEGRVVQLAAAGPVPQIRGAVAEGPSVTVVHLDNLPQPAPGRAYEVWLIPAGGQPIGVGLSRAGQGGTQTIPLDRGLSGIQTVAITEEPAGGSPAPTSPILAAVRL